jgi:hypothetical protein
MTQDEKGRGLGILLLFAAWEITKGAIFALGLVWLFQNFITGAS